MTPGEINPFKIILNKANNVGCFPSLLSAPRLSFNRNIIIENTVHFIAMFSAIRLNGSNRIKDMRVCSHKPSR